MRATTPFWSLPSTETTAGLAAGIPRNYRRRGGGANRAPPPPPRPPPAPGPVQPQGARLPDLPSPRAPVVNTLTAQFATLGGVSPQQGMVLHAVQAGADVVRVD